MHYFFFQSTQMMFVLKPRRSNMSSGGLCRISSRVVVFLRICSFHHLATFSKDYSVLAGRGGATHNLLLIHVSHTKPDIKYRSVVCHRAAFHLSELH